MYQRKKFDNRSAFDAVMKKLVAYFWPTVYNTVHLELK